MAVQYKKLTEEELSTFIQMRISQLREEGATEDIDLKPAFMDYYNQLAVTYLQCTGTYIPVKDSKRADVTDNNFWLMLQICQRVTQDIKPVW